MNRLGVYGGCFDPPHVGHLILARLTREEFTLDEVIFIPAAHPPHKEIHTSFDTRTEMLRQAICDEEGFSLSLIERDRNLSYTVDTLRAIAEYSAPGSQIVFDYMLPEQFIPPDEMRSTRALRKFTEQRGEPLIGEINPADLADLLDELGWDLLEDLDVGAQMQRYFVNRRDGLRPCAASSATPSTDPWTSP